MGDRSIVNATRENCVEYQMTARGFAYDAQYHLEQGTLGAAKEAQRKSAIYHEAARERLERLIGVS